MTTEQKKQLIEAANAYIKLNALSNNEVSRQTKINSGYLSNMLRFQFHTSVEGKEVPIGEKWFEKLAEFVAFKVDKEYWSKIKTRQFVEGITKLNECKEEGKTGLIIGITGAGKTDFINTFCNKNPQYTYRITVSSLYNLIDIINELCEKTGVDTYELKGVRPSAYGLKTRVEKLIDRLKEVKQNGGKPIIIFDEGENMEISVLKMLKGLYDGLKDHCAIVIIGTEQLMNKLLNLRKRNRDAIPQLYRRFKAGLKTLSPINKEEEFPKFFEKLEVSDKTLCRLLTDISDNYGELHDYLEPFLKYCFEKGKSVNEETFRIYHDMPKKKAS